MPADDEIKQTVERYLETIPLEAEVELAFFGGTFTGLEMREQERLLKLVNEYVERGRIEKLRLSTRPDYIEKENLKMLKRWGVRTVELGVQSLDEEVLEASGRGYGLKEVERAAEMIRAEDLELGMQMMIGLPKDSREKSVQTAKEMVRMGAKNSRVYPTLVMRNTHLAMLYKKGLYEPLSLEEAVEWTKEILWVFEENDVLVQRVGLHPTEGLIEGSDYLAGPFHVSFKEMVMTAMWGDIWERELRKTQGGEKVRISVAPNMLGVAAGYKGKNKKWMKDKRLSVSFEGDDLLKKFEYRIEVTSEK